MSPSRKNSLDRLFILASLLFAFSALSFERFNIGCRLSVHVAFIHLIDVTVLLFHFLGKKMFRRYSSL